MSLFLCVIDKMYLLRGEKGMDEYLYPHVSVECSSPVLQ